MLYRVHTRLVNRPGCRSRVHREPGAMSAEKSFNLLGLLSQSSPRSGINRASSNKMFQKSSEQALDDPGHEIQRV